MRLSSKSTILCAGKKLDNALLPILFIIAILFCHDSRSIKKESDVAFMSKDSFGIVSQLLIIKEYNNIFYYIIQYFFEHTNPNPIDQNY
ncbi:MAG: hypothetical protein NVSMB46_04430 [Candidatus Saccharimonadales bacterium]